MRNDFSPQEFTILIVDDTPTNLKVVGEYLSRAGFRILIARNGESALQRVEHGRPHLILLDVLMPGINGFELCQILKEDPDMAAIPVIFMTALNETEHKIRGFGVGAVDYVTKPIHQEELLARVRAHLEIRSLTESLEQRVAQRTAALREALDKQQHLTNELKEALLREQQLSAVQNRVMQVVSHEFRTPLNAINNSTTLFINYYDRLSQEKRNKMAGHIRESIMYMIELLNTTLRLQSIGDGSLAVSDADVDVYALCCEVAANMTTQYGQRSFEIVHSGPKVVRSDPTHLQQILQALISNACKFSDADGPIYLHSVVDETQIQISVRDAGIGIEADDLPHLFDMFYRGSNTIGYPGLGVGLAIVEKLTKLLGGEIGYRSDGAGLGSCAELTLPVITNMEADNSYYPHSQPVVNGAHSGAATVIENGTS